MTQIEINPIYPYLQWILLSKKDHFLNFSTLILTKNYTQQQIS